MKWNREFLPADVREAAKAHAMREYPKESCGLVVNDTYIPCFNYALDPTKDFVIAPETLVKETAKGKLQAVLHSHPDGPYYPSQADMQGQLQTDVPWGVIVTDGERASDPIMWGDTLPIEPLIGREFMHGVADCWTLIRDSFRIGKEGMAAQDMPEWPYDPIVMPMVPREDSWWEGKDNFYEEMFYDIGWRKISPSDARPGDGFMSRVRSTKLNHAGLLVGNNLILHHLPTRLSRREPAGIWARSADLWLRYEGK